MPLDHVDVYVLAKFTDGDGKTQSGGSYGASNVMGGPAKAIRQGQKIMIQGEYVYSHEGTPPSERQENVTFEMIRDAQGQVTIENGSCSLLHKSYYEEYTDTYYYASSFDGPIPVSYHNDYYSANGKWLTSANYEVKTHGSHMVNGEWVVDTYTKNGSMQSTDDNSIGIHVKVGIPE